MSHTRRILIDTDPGTDDALAILMALSSHSIDIVGLTTVGGNVPLARSTRNALAILEYAGRREMPVWSGASRPIKGSYRYAYYFHGRGGLSARLRDPRTGPQPGAAVDAMNSVLRSGDRPATLVALGPLTNLGKLVRSYPDVVGHVGEMIIMGGAVDSPGNITPQAEFNIFNDPVAADIVLSVGAPIKLVDLTACRQVSLTRGDVRKFPTNGPFGRLAARILHNWFGGRSEGDSYTPCDPLAMAIAIEPDIATTELVRINVKVEQGESWGQTQPGTGGSPVKLVKGVDGERFRELFFGLLGTR